MNTFGRVIEIMMRIIEFSKVVEYDYRCMAKMINHNYAYIKIGYI